MPYSSNRSQLYLAHAGLGGQIRVLVLLRHKGMTQSSIERLEHLSSKLAAEAQLALLVPVVAGLQIFDRATVPARLARHKP